MTLIVHSSAPVKRPVPTEAMIERRNQILGMSYGVKSLSYLLEEKKLWSCSLLGEKEYTYDSFHIKYSKWLNVPVPHIHLSPLDEPPVFRSLVKAPKRIRAEEESIENRMLSMYSPTMLRTQPSQLINFPHYLDNHFFIWPNPDLLVHRFYSCLQSF